MKYPKSFKIKIKSSLLQKKEKERLLFSVFDILLSSPKRIKTDLRKFRNNN